LWDRGAEKTSKLIKPNNPRYNCPIDHPATTLINVPLIRGDMGLEEYLESLRNCPDEQLTDELGIYDNWPIFLDADFDRVIKYLRESGKYKNEQIQEHEKTGRGKTGTNHTFDYIPGTVAIQAFNWIPLYLTTGFGLKGTKSDRDESDRQSRDYTVTIQLHNAQKLQMEGVHPNRALAIVAEELAQFIIRENISACLPNTIGWKYIHKNDHLKIIYHEPMTSDHN